MTVEIKITIIFYSYNDLFIVGFSNYFMSSDVTLNLKMSLINYDGKKVKDLENVIAMKQRYPTLAPDQLIDKCPNLTFGKILPTILLQFPAKDAAEKLKLFRWASKIQDKLTTNKGHLVLDENQLAELNNFVENSTFGNIVTIAPILIHFEELKNELVNLKTKPKKK